MTSADSTGNPRDSTHCCSSTFVEACGMFPMNSLGITFLPFSSSRNAQHKDCAVVGVFGEIPSPTGLFCGYSRGRDQTLFRCADGFLGLLVISLACLVQFCVVVENELFEDGVTRKTFEMVLSHFAVGTIRIPAVVCHSIDSSHHTGAVTASLAVYENGLVCGVVDETQEPGYGSFGRT